MRWRLAVSTLLLSAASWLSPGRAAAPTAPNVHLPRPPYPMRARQYLEQGSGVIHFSTDALGKTAQVFMKRPTGYSDLDESTINFARAQWKAPPNFSIDVPVDFRLIGPNHDSGLGTAVPGQWYHPPPHYPPQSVRLLESGTGRVRVTTDASGSVVHAEMSQSTGVKRLDENSITYASGFWKGPPNSTQEFPVRYEIKLPH